MASAPARVRVAVAAGHPGVRASLRQRLSTPHIFVTGEAGAADEVIDLARREPIDVLLLDLHLPPGGAVSALGGLLLVAPDLAAVVLVPEGETVKAGDMVASGCRGFLPRDADLRLLEKCVTRVHAGEYWIARDQVRELAGRIRAAADEDETRRRFASLSTRELAIVAAVLRGQANKDIAGRLGVSPQTVKNHLSNIFGKVGVASRLELALAALHVTPVFASFLRAGPNPGTAAPSETGDPPPDPRQTPQKP